MKKEVLHEYRDSVVDKKYGEELRKAIKGLPKDSPLFRKHYKRYPRGFSAEDNNSEFLLYNALYTYTEEDIPRELHSADFADYIFEKCLKTSALHKWVVEMVRRSQEPKNI